MDQPHYSGESYKTYRNSEQTLDIFNKKNRKDVMDIEK